MKKNFPILYYHFINSPSSNTRIKGLYTSKKHFDWQLNQLIKKGFTFITFEDIIKERYDMNDRNIILTFDDGCESLYVNAFPILKKYGIKAVIYVVAESIGARNIVWEQNENKDPLNILTKEQLIEMSEYGIEIGSHLCNHVHLSKLSVSNIKHELLESKRLLENELGQKIYSVAYPFGSYNNAVLEIAEKVGYQFGVTTKTGNNLTARNLELFRVPVKGCSLRHYWRFNKSLKNILKNSGLE
jgi:peptidoglycan/xylan/chitin deacetylase (PgdA/CDA1 family)